jgi:feruloyl-CoA synthase
MAESPVEVFAPPRVVPEARRNGTVILRSEDGLLAPEVSISHVFHRRAAEHPERVLAAERIGETWVELSWGDAAATARAIAQALLDHGLGPDRPLMVLSGNSLAHLQLMLGAFDAGVPIIPVSVAYSLQSKDHDRIRQIAELCTPGMAFSEDAERFGAALASLRELVPLQCVGQGDAPEAIPLTDLTSTEPSAAVERASVRVGSDTVAKILFTSGSTGAPKGVINTHRMMCSNQRALGQTWPFLHVERPTLVDWLPWSHTFGGNHNLNQVIHFGGSLYIDDGRPVKPLFERTIEALRQVPPTVYYNVPAGYALLTPRLEEDRDFAETFFSRLRFMFYAAAALPVAIWDRLRAVADEVADHPVPLTAAWGATETAPAATSAHFASAKCGCIGVPIPGTTIKLVPEGEKLEIRVRGPNVTPGYFRNAAATTAAFDEDGFYRTGDAARLVDPDDPNQGLMFDGRLAEDFKLVTGTWVHVGALRNALVSSAGILQDVVICGHGAARVGALAWLSPLEAGKLVGSTEDVSRKHPVIRKHLGSVLARLNEGRGSAMRVDRLLLLSEPPDIDVGEITDKGYVNQRKVLAHRADSVARVLAEPPDDDVIRPA